MPVKIIKQVLRIVVTYPCSIWVINQSRLMVWKDIFANSCFVICIVVAKKNIVFLLRRAVRFHYDSFKLVATIESLIADIFQSSW